MQKRQIEVVYSNERLITPSGLNIVGSIIFKMLTDDVEFNLD